MKLSYAWAMADRWTFRMKPIESFLLPFVQKAARILVPFAGEYRFTHPNIDYIDLDQYPGVIQGDALEVLPKLKGPYDLIISDPPYTMFQAVHTYGNKKLQDITVIKREYNRLLSAGGYVIHCGYNSTGCGKKHGFVKQQLLIVNCGGSHNDYLILAEQKTQQSLEEAFK